MTETIIRVVATLVIVGFSGGTGIWLGLRMVRKQGQIPQDEPALRHIRAGLRRNRKARRELLTRGERFVAWTMALLSMVLVPAGLIILLSGDTSLRLIGIAMLLLALIVAAVPISPILPARVRRRQRTEQSH